MESDQEAGIALLDEASEDEDDQATADAYARMIGKVVSSATRRFEEQLRLKRLNKNKKKK